MGIQLEKLIAPRVQGPTVVVPLAKSEGNQFFPKRPVSRFEKRLGAHFTRQGPKREKVKLASKYLKSLFEFSSFPFCSVGSAGT
jgi:hypothetical protein